MIPRIPPVRMRPSMRINLIRTPKTPVRRLHTGRDSVVTQPDRSLRNLNAPNIRHINLRGLASPPSTGKAGWSLPPHARRARWGLMPPHQAEMHEAPPGTAMISSEPFTCLADATTALIGQTAREPESSLRAFGILYDGRRKAFFVCRSEDFTIRAERSCQIVMTAMRLGDNLGDFMAATEMTIPRTTRSKLYSVGVRSATHYVLIETEHAAPPTDDMFMLYRTMHQVHVDKRHASGPTSEQWISLHHRLSESNQLFIRMQTLRAITPARWMRGERTIPGLLSAGFIIRETDRLYGVQQEVPMHVTRIDRAHRMIHLEYPLCLNTATYHFEARCFTVAESETDQMLSVAIPMRPE